VLKKLDSTSGTEIASLSTGLSGLRWPVHLQGLGRIGAAYLPGGFSDGVAWWAYDLTGQGSVDPTGTANLDSLVGGPDGFVQNFQVSGFNAWEVRRIAVPDGTVHNL